MIIGAGHAEAWLGGEVKMGSMGGPMALNTLLGWTLVGTWGKKSTNSAALNFLSSEDGSLKEAVQGSVAPPKGSAGQAPQNPPQKKVQRVLSPPKGVLDRVSQPPLRVVPCGDCQPTPSLPSKMLLRPPEIHPRGKYREFPPSAK